MFILTTIPGEFGFFVFALPFLLCEPLSVGSESSKIWAGRVTIQTR